MHIYLYFNEKNFKPCKMFIYVCMYVCMSSVEIQFQDKFSVSTFQGEFKYHSFKAMQANK